MSQEFVDEFKRIQKEQDIELYKHIYMINQDKQYRDKTFEKKQPYVIDEMGQFPSIAELDRNELEMIFAKAETLDKHKIYPIKPSEALRYNEGKLRYDLLDPYAIAELAKVFTNGANKYADHNWKKGMKWSKMLASMKRHIAAFEMGEDIDPEIGCHHMAQAAWNALGLVTYARIHPEMDDRQHSYLETKRIGLDIDEVLANFTRAYSEETGKEPEPDHWSFCYKMMENFENWKQGTIDGSNKSINGLDSFYIRIKPLCDAKLPFEPICYITNRPVSTDITKQWLENHKFPLKPVFTTKSREEKVAIALEQRLDYFIDDSFETFVEMNKAGICCFLMNGSHNQKYNVGYKRIKSLEDFKNRFL